MAACEGYLRADVPVFASRSWTAWPSASAGELTAGSFGTSRCQLIAEAIVDAHERRARSLDARLDAVARRFADQRAEPGGAVPGVQGSVNLYVL